METSHLYSKIFYKLFLEFKAQILKKERCHIIGRVLLVGHKNNKSSMLRKLFCYHLLWLSFMQTMVHSMIVEFNKLNSKCCTKTKTSRSWLDSISWIQNYYLVLCNCTFEIHTLLMNQSFEDYMEKHIFCTLWFNYSQTNVFSMKT